jgi:ribose 5-phosphate isomerase B
MIYLASDYAGYKLKEAIKEYLAKKKIKCIDFGTDTDKVKNDFTDFAYPVAKRVSKSKKDLGILVCGSGVGMSIAANRFRYVQATLVHTVRQAKWAKILDNSNVLCLSAWTLKKANAMKIIDVWLKTPFQKLPRRIRRFKKLDSWRT